MKACAVSSILGLFEAAIIVEIDEVSWKGLYLQERRPLRKVSAPWKFARRQMVCNILYLVSIGPSSRGEPLFRQKRMREDKEKRSWWGQERVWFSSGFDVSFWSLRQSNALIPEDG